MANRKDVCQKIRDLNLQDAVKEKYGDNYTRVSTDKLEALIAEKTAEKSAESAVPTQAEKKTSPLKRPDKEATIVESPYEAACLTFLSILKDSGSLDDLLKKL